ncbi:hypothetical protein TNCV_1715391 [Trichonephila clavipes]|nr:hypothetical protein TNCV_1715391 [Trichonephila clavipes]
MSDDRNNPKSMQGIESAVKILNGNPSRTNDAKGVLLTGWGSSSLDKMIRCIDLLQPREKRNKIALIRIPEMRHSRNTLFKVY